MQSQINAYISTLAISHTLEKKFYSSTIRYIGSTMSPHGHVVPFSLRRLVHDFSHIINLNKLIELKD